MVVIKANVLLHKDDCGKRVRELTEQYKNGCMYLLAFEELVAADDSCYTIKYDAQAAERSEGVTACGNLRDWK